MSTNQMLPFRLLEQEGILPIKTGVVKFAIGDPSTKTSNSWKIWERNGSIYIAGRDNFQQAKVSLHPKHWYSQLDQLITDLIMRRSYERK